MSRTAPISRVRAAILWAVVSTTLCLQSCTGGPSKPGVADPVSWDQLTGWTTDTQSAAWTALLRSCSRIGRDKAWTATCRAAQGFDKPTDAEARSFFHRHFRPHPLYGEGGRREGLITGYYVPLLRGSFEPDKRYRYPIYGRPPDLLNIDLAGVYPALAGRQLRGRVQGRTVVPYPDRAELQADPQALAGSELLWVDDPLDAFFLQVQGSGRVELPDGRVVALAYADNNGRPYRSIGKCLIKEGKMSREDVNLFTIRRWLRAHPDEAARILDCDPRVVFFRVKPGAPGSPEGSLGVPLTAGRSLAVDRDKIPLGAPIWLETSMPGHSHKPFNRLMMAQDTGGGVRGYTRADVFWGEGPKAERKAGLMKQKGRMFVLLPIRP